jgi:UPF0716 protein FxsA
MPLLLILLFVLVPIAELYVILQVGDAIGAVPTLLILVADSLLGAVLLRAQGRTVWRQFNGALAEERMPHRELFDGVAVIFGAALLLTPGFLTDFVGLLLLIPPTRTVLRRLAAGWLGRRLGLSTVIGAAGAATRAGRAARTRRAGRPDDGETVDGTAREHPEDPPQGRIGPA